MSTREQRAYAHGVWVKWGGSELLHVARCAVGIGCECVPYSYSTCLACQAEAALAKHKAATAHPQESNEPRQQQPQGQPPSGHKQESNKEQDDGRD